MKKIEIITTQNVPIQYEAAELKDRIIACILDFIIMVILALIFLFIIAKLVFQSLELTETFSLLVVIPVLGLYHLILENVMRGQTPGKKIMGIKVIKLNGDVPGFIDFFIRWLFQWIEIYSCSGSIAALMISATQNAQRMGDILANTTVIKTKGFRNIGLTELLNLPSRENYSVKYPGVTRYSDEDMLLIKQLMERNKKYPNPTNEQLLEETVDRMTEQLQLNKRPYDNMRFLQEIINDYIVLTR